MHSTLLLALGFLSSVSTQDDMRTFSMPTRIGVCAGRAPDEITFDRPTEEKPGCPGGAAAISISRKAGRISDVHATVGARIRGLATDRSIIRALMQAVPTLKPKSAAHAIQAVALVQNGATSMDLLGFATDTKLAAEPRRMAITWMQIVAGQSANEVLERIASLEGDDISVREQALIAMGPAGAEVALRISKTSKNEKMRRIATQRAKAAGAR